MEDAVDALKMAFSVFSFVLALVIVFSMFSQAREVSDIVISKTDNTYFAKYEFPDGSTNGRTVGIETIMPTLYRYYKEKFSIDIISDTSSLDTKSNEKFDIDVERAVFNGTTKYDNLYSDGIVWLGNPDIDTQNRVSAYIKGKDSGKADTINGTELRKYRDYNLEKYRDKTFTETFEQKTNGEEKYTADDGSVIYLVKGTTKLHIDYTMQ